MLKKLIILSLFLPLTARATDLFLFEGLRTDWEKVFPQLVCQTPEAPQTSTDTTLVLNCAVAETTCPPRVYYHQETEVFTKVINTHSQAMVNFLISLNGVLLEWQRLWASSVGESYDIPADHFKTLKEVSGLVFTISERIGANTGVVDSHLKKQLEVLNRCGYTKQAKKLESLIGKYSEMHINISDYMNFGVSEVLANWRGEFKNLEGKNIKIENVFADNFDFINSVTAQKRDLVEASYAIEDVMSAYLIEIIKINADLPSINIEKPYNLNYSSLIKR